MLEQAMELLKTYFGYSSFRKGQENTIDSIINKNDTLAIMPTGGGKSICYQIPALLFDGVTIVISPLISLMKDQVDQLKELNIPSTYINSSISTAEIENRIREAQNGTYKLIYIAPERLESASFRSLLQSLHVSMIAIDEAHCISQWGHDFRPSYRSIFQMIAELPTKPVIVALTATATQKVTTDICNQLRIKSSNVFVTGFARENLTFEVLKGANRRDFITSYIKENRMQSGIIYAATRKEVNELYQYLHRSGFAVAKYHAGISEEERNAAQEAFLHDNVSVIIATNAFGMGINKSNVRYVIHHNLPKNIEAYYQEAGRAGRDGETSECYVLFSAQDIQLQKFLIDQTSLDEVKKQQEFMKLQQMIDYCHTEKCLQRYILEYFGDFDNTENCGRCMNCKDNREKIEITTETLMIFSCIKRMNERFGKTLVAQVLRGSKNKRIEEFGFKRLSTYGLLKHHSEKYIVALLDFLVAEDYLAMTNSQYPVLVLAKKAIPVLKGEEKVYKKEERKRKQIVTNNELFELLREVRKNIASSEKLPPYIVFSDSTLREMSEQYPIDEEAMLQIKGVAQAKLERFGHEFIAAIRSYVEQNGIEKKNAVEVDSEKAQTSKPDQPSYFISFEMFEAGREIKEIATERNMSPTTIQNHIIRSISEGKTIDWERIIPRGFEEIIYTKIDEIGAEKLKPLKDALPDEIDYFAIKGAICKKQLV